MLDWRNLIGVELPDSALEIRAGMLELGGVPVREHLARNGGHATYLYDATAIIRRVERLRAAFGEGVGLRYAVKANPNPALLRLLADYVDGFDVASSTELDAAVAAGASPDTVTLAGPGKAITLLDHAVARGVVVCAESPREISWLAELGDSRKSSPRILLRVNPPFGLRGSGMRMSGTASQFGIDSETIPDLLRRLPPPLELEGLHVFCGSQCLDAEAIAEMYQSVSELAADLGQHFSFPMRRMTVGSGLGIPYAQGDPCIDLEAAAAAFKRAFATLHGTQPAARPELELGRYLVGEAGVYACQVVEIKQSRGEKFLITNGGMHHHSAATGNLGQIIKRPYPMCLAERVTLEEREPVNVVGALCTPLDVLGRQVMLPPAQEGDTIVVFQSGAYGLTASPTAFLGHPPPGEFLVLSSHGP